MWELYIILVEAYNCRLYTADDIIVVIMAAPDSRSQSFSRFRPLEYVLVFNNTIRYYEAASVFWIK